MPDLDRMEGEFRALFASPRYAALIDHRNQFRGQKAAPVTPASIAVKTAEMICLKNALLNPVEIAELSGPVELYRAHDGGSSFRSAGTLGQFWFEREVLQIIWKSTERYAGAERQSTFMEFIRTANFVLPEWNRMLQLACMSVPAGSRVVVARGRGNWRAMRTGPNSPRPLGKPNIATAGDVMDHLRIMPIPGTMQCVVPLFNDNWVRPVVQGSAAWPFLA